jgi:hypothetical protein
MTYLNANLYIHNSIEGIKTFYNKINKKKIFALFEIKKTPLVCWYRLNLIKNIYYNFFYVNENASLILFVYACMLG